MSTADDILNAPIFPDDDAKRIKAPTMMVCKILAPDLAINIQGRSVLLGQSKGILYFKRGDDITVGIDRYIVVVEGDYDTAEVEAV